jgi:hypothetical protein
VVRYVLVKWPAKGEKPDEVVFEANLDDVTQIDLLTDRLLGTISGILINAKDRDPLGFYTPIRPYRSSTGAGILVLRDGFLFLKPNFKALVQGLLDEFQERRAKIAS